MDKEIKLFFDLYATTFASVSREHLFMYQTEEQKTEHVERFYASCFKEARDKHILDPERLYISAKYLKDGKSTPIEIMPDSLQKSIASMHGIRVLEISYFAMTQDQIFKTLRQLPTLEEVGLMSCNIKHLALPDALSKWLRRLDLRDNALEKLPSILLRFRRLEELVLTNNPIVTVNPKLRTLVQHSNMDKQAQEIIRAVFIEESATITLNKYKEQLILDCINPIKDALKEVDSSKLDADGAVFGIAPKNPPHKINFSSMYYKHVYISFILYYKSYFDPNDNFMLRVNEKHLFSAISNAKYEYQMRSKSEKLSLIEQFEIVYFWFYTTKPFEYSSRLKRATNEILTLIHLLTVMKILEESNKLSSNPIIMKRESKEVLKKLILTPPEDPFNARNQVKIKETRVLIRQMLEHITPLPLQNCFEYGEGAYRKAIEKKIIDLECASDS